jgi:5'-3' exonuclease
MGIERLGPLLAQHGVTSSFRSLGQFKGKVVALDASNVVSMFLATAHRQLNEARSLADLVWDRNATGHHRAVVEGVIERAARFVELFLVEGVHPVWILDGRSPTEEMKQAKARTRNERAKAKERDRIVAAELRTTFLELEKRNGPGYIEALSSDPATAAAMAFEAPPPPEGTGSGESPFVLEKKLRTVLARTYASFTHTDMDELVSLLDSLGVPVFEAPDEGERLAAVWARNGIVDAVFTTDTDVLAHGAPLMMKSHMTNFAGASFVECMLLSDVVRKAPGCDGKQERFIDLCLLLGCDFNIHPKGVGPVRALKLHQERILDAFPSRVPDALRGELDAMNIPWCRAFFLGKPEGADETTREDLMFDPNAATRNPLLVNLQWGALKAEIQARVQEAWKRAAGTASA